MLDDLGFSRVQASPLKLEAEVLRSILDEIDAKQYTAKDLVEKLDEYQPQVSNLMRGEISKMSQEKLLVYCDRLGIGVSIPLRPVAPSESGQRAEKMIEVRVRGRQGTKET